MNFLFQILIFFLGLSLGSFLNVLVWRDGNNRKLKNKKLKSIRDKLLGRSVCDHCQRKLCWWENIPVFSFLLLRGRCRTCLSPVPLQYPLVELSMGMFFLLISLKSSNFLSLLVSLIIFFLLAAVFLYDLHYRIIPDWTIVSLAVFALAFLVLEKNSTLHYFWTGLLSFGFLLFLHLVTRGKGMGLGDVKFAFAMGLFLGWPKILVAFYVAFLTGALVGFIMILLKKAKIKSVIAFGPFLVLGTLATWFWGEEIIVWFLNFYA